MEKLWIHKRFNRRVFIALLFSIIITRKGNTTDKNQNIECDWCWSGAVTNDSIIIKAKLNREPRKGKDYIQIFYDLSPNSRLTSDNLHLKKVAATSLVNSIATFELTNLLEDTVYHYVIVANGRRYPIEETLKFQTIKVSQPYSFAIACSSCAGGTFAQLGSYGVSNSKVFDVIRKSRHRANGRDALALFIHLGDLHYRNDFPTLGLQENSLDDYRYNYDLVMNQSRQRNLYQNVPLAYIWDDHDYGTNDSDGSYAFKYLASQAYREQVPHYPLVEALNKTQSQGAIYQSFIIGRVRFVMTDSRFYQDPRNIADDGNKTLLGSQQKQWLFSQFLTGKNRQESDGEKLTIWLNTIPWIVQENDHKTASWNKFARERTEIANFIQENKIDRLLMISGDAHMLAIDDGTAGTANSYATGGGGSFPVIQTASLDSRGSYKGGPYNGEKYIVNSDIKSKNGAIPGKGQWGLLNFIDDGNKIEVRVELKRMEKTMIKHSFIFD